MTALRARLGLALFPLVVVVAVVVASLPATKHHRDAVGTNGPDPTETTDPSPHLEPGDTPTTSTTAAGAGRVVTSNAPPTSEAATSTSSSTPPRATTSTTAPTPIGPHDLLGRVLYSSGGETATALHSMRPDGTDRRAEVGCPLPYGGYLYPSALSPDGTQVVRACGVTAPFTDGDPWGKFEWVLQRVDGTGLVPLRSALSNTIYPSWSPDGSRIALPDGGKVHLFDAEGGPLDDLVIAQDDAVNTVDANRLSWSPDGQHVVVDGWSGLAIIDMTSGYVERLVTQGPYPPIRLDLATWSPDGQWIYYREVVPGQAGAPGAVQLRRIHPDPTSYPEIVADIPDPTSDDLSPPTFLDDETALFQRYGDLWVLTVDNTPTDRPDLWRGNLMKVETDFLGYFLSFTPRPSALPTTG